MLLVVDNVVKIEAIIAVDDVVVVAVVDDAFAIKIVDVLLTRTNCDVVDVCIDNVLVVAMIHLRLNEPVPDSTVPTNMLQLAKQKPWYKYCELLQITQSEVNCPLLHEIQFDPQVHADPTLVPLVVFRLVHAIGVYAMQLVPSEDS